MARQYPGAKGLRTMARPSPKVKAGKRSIKHGDAIAGLPGQPEIVSHGTGLTQGGPKSIKGPGVNAKIKGKVKGM
jgi:hypothetical protein